MPVQQTSKSSNTGTVLEARVGDNELQMILNRANRLARVASKTASKHDGALPNRSRAFPRTLKVLRSHASRFCKHFGASDQTLTASSRQCCFLLVPVGNAGTGVSEKLAKQRNRGRCVKSRARAAVPFSLEPKRSCANCVWLLSRLRTAALLKRIPFYNTAKQWRTLQKLALTSVDPSNTKFSFPSSLA